METLGNDLRSLQKTCHEIAKSKGFWDEELNDGEMIALMHSELSEALEALREGNWSERHGVAEELAACVIRILAFCGGRNLDLLGEIEKKMEKNKAKYRMKRKKYEEKKNSTYFIPWSINTVIYGSNVCF